MTSTFDYLNLILIIINFGLSLWERNLPAAAGWFTALLWFGAAQYTRIESSK